MKKNFGRPVVRQDLININNALAELRDARDEVSPAPMRGDAERTAEELNLFHKFNDAIDRLNVLESLLIEVYREQG